MIEQEARKIAILADSTNLHLRDYLRGVSDFVRESPGWSLHGFGLPCYLQIPHPEDWQGDGCLLLTPPQTAAAQIISQQSKVTISVGKLSHSISSISHDIRSGILKILQHLAGQGCRKIILYKIKSRKLVQLLEGFGQKLNLNIEQPSQLEMALTIASTNPPVGVLVPDCQSALEVQSMARAEHLPAPIITALGDDKNCQVSGSGISSLAYPARELGYRAAQLLQHQINHPIRTRHLVYGETELRTRHSSQLEQIDDEIVREALNQIRRKVPHSPMRVSELAQSIGVSRTNLTERFQEKLGLTPADLIRRERLTIAKRRLKRPEEMVKSVALSMGFPSSQDFARFFKNATGQTPSEFAHSENSGQNATQSYKMHHL